MTRPDEAQRPISAMGDAYARSDGQGESGLGPPCAYGEVTGIQSASVVCASDGESFGQFARPVCQAAGSTVPLSAAIHFSDASQRFEGSDKNTAWLTFFFGHHVQAFVHTVNEVDVGAAGRPEQDCGAPGQAFGCVSGQIFEAQVGLGFDDLAGSLSVDEHAAEQIARQIGRRTREEFELEPGGFCE